MRLFGSDVGGLGGVGFGPQAGGLAADQCDQRLTDPDRLARRDQNTLNATADSGGDGGAGVDHRFDPSGQPRLGPAAPPDADHDDAHGLGLGGI
ncbi:hypothetical protein D3C80_1186210 [compost metagenome]